MKSIFILTFLTIISHLGFSQDSNVVPSEEITDQEVLTFYYAVGTQTIAPSYGHTNDDRLIETAKANLIMGSNILKISLDPDKYFPGRPANIGFSPKVLVRDDHSFKKVLDMPFNYFFLDMFSFQLEGFLFYC